MQQQDGDLLAGPALLAIAYEQYCSDADKLEALEDWSHRAVQELQEFLDAAREAMGSEDALPGVAALIDEFDSIQQIFSGGNDDDETEEPAE